MKKVIILSLAIVAVAATTAGVAAQHSAVTEQPTVTPTYLQDTRNGQILQPAPGAVRTQDAASTTYFQPASH